MDARGVCEQRALLSAELKLNKTAELNLNHLGQAVLWIAVLPHHCQQWTDHSHHLVPVHNNTPI